MMVGRALPRWLVPTVAAAVVLPIAIAVLAQRQAHWFPVFDLAMTELRVRDVGGAHTPLIGLQGRIGPTGSHPGPLSFYVLAPVYRLLGSSAFALQVATAVFHAMAAMTALLVVVRRRDPRAVVAVAVLLLMQGYGLGPLTEPWNPHLPMLWFVVFLVAAWAVLEGDVAMLVPLVVAGSICAQTHVPYLPVTLGVGGAVLAVALWHAKGRHPSGRPDWRWVAAALAVGVVLWAPPLIDEATNDPGNLTQLVDHLGHPDDPPIGMRAASRLVLERLDAWQLAVVEVRHPGTYNDVLGGPGPTRDRGLVTVIIWAVAAAVSLALRHRRLLVLHSMVGLSAMVAVVAISRIYGAAWYYLMLWCVAIGALMLVAIITTGVVLIARLWPAGRVDRLVVPIGLAVVLALAVHLVMLAPDARTGTPENTAQLGRLVPDTIAALDDHAGAATGRSGRYLVTWDDATNGGSEGLGLVNELVRHGYDVGVEARDAVRVPSYRARSPHSVTARIVFASGGWIDRWTAEPGARMVAMDDPRSTTERQKYARARAKVIAALVDSGRADLVPRVDTDLFGIALNEGVSKAVGLLLGRMLAIGVPAAVLIVPGGGS